MKSFVFFVAIFVFLAQIQTQSQVQAHVVVPDFAEFFKQFFSKLPMNPDEKAKLESNGNACLNLTSQVISHSIQAFQLGGSDTISSLRELIGAVEIVEGSLLPKCLETYQQIITFGYASENLWQIRTPARFEIWRSKLIQIGARMLIELSQNQTAQAAEDLTLFFYTTFGHIMIYFPQTIESDPAKYVAFNQEKAIPLFLRGFFDTLGVNNQTKINGTIQCIVGLTNSIQPVLQELTSRRGDFFTQANTLLDQTMAITDALERCNQIEKVGLESVRNAIEMITSHPKESFLKMAGITLSTLPRITQSNLEMEVYFEQGKYELVGQEFANNLLRVYQGLLL